MCNYNEHIIIIIIIKLQIDRHTAYDITGNRQHNNYVYSTRHALKQQTRMSYT